jgi:phosphohistidine phosphatase
MDIYLIRHADALPTGSANVKKDEERPLSEEGWKQAACLGRALKARGAVPELIVSSPLVRSLQTATELRTIFDLSDQHVVTRGELEPGGRPKKLARYLNGLPWTKVALVGHQPDLGYYAGWLIGEKKVHILFEKGGAALIRTEGSIAKGSGALVWLVTQEWAE